LKGDINGKRADLSWADLMGIDKKQMPQYNMPTINDYIKTHDIKQIGTKIIVFKGVNDAFESPNASEKIKYIAGIHEVEFTDCDVWQDCSFGINLSPTKETAKEWGSKVLAVEIDIGDIVCLPIYGHNKKFRVKRCKVLGEVK
jgi:hypothetical protein